VIGIFLFFFLSMDFSTAKMFRVNGKFKLFDKEQDSVPLYVLSCVMFGLLSFTERLTYYKIAVKKLDLVIGVHQMKTSICYERIINMHYVIWFYLYWFLFISGASGNILFITSLVIGVIFGELLLFNPKNVSNQPSLSLPDNVTSFEAMMSSSSSSVKENDGRRMMVVNPNGSMMMNSPLNLV
jgi:hypothetical protein